MSQELKGMNLLVFAPSFFSYEKAIVEKLKSMDAEVIFLMKDHQIQHLENLFCALVKNYLRG